jgi:pentatricopeptide repeat protein
MQKQYDDGISDVKPNVQTYSTVISAWARGWRPITSRSILRSYAEAICFWNHRCQPNTVTFNTVIDAYAKSQDPSAPEKAEALLYRMQADYKAGNMLCEARRHQLQHCH